MQMMTAPINTFSNIDGAECCVRMADSIGFVSAGYKETKKPVEGAVVFAPALWQWD